MQKLLLLTLVLWTTVTSFSQSSPETGYVRMVVKDIQTLEDEITIDTWMRSQPGVVMSRSDHNTHIYFAHYSVASGLTEDSFKTWLSTLGFESSCSVSGLNNGEPIPSFPKSCFGTREIEPREVEIRQE